MGTRNALYDTLARPWTKCPKHISCVKGACSLAPLDPSVLVRFSQCLVLDSESFVFLEPWYICTTALPGARSPLWSTALTKLIRMTLCMCPGAWLTTSTRAQCPRSWAPSLDLQLCELGRHNNWTSHATVWRKDEDFARWYLLSKDNCTRICVIYV